MAMEIDDYLAAPGVKARNALTTETRLDVLRAVATRDSRTIVAAKAAARLRALGDGLPLVYAEAATEATPRVSAGTEPEVLAPGAFAPEGVTPTLVPAEPAPEPAPEVEPRVPEPERAVPEPELAAEVGALELPQSLPATPVVEDPPSWGSKVSLTEALWTCTKCGTEAPPAAFGTRTINGRVYRQPQCRGCRAEASRVATKKAKARKIKALTP